MQETKKLLSNTIIIFIGTLVGSIFSYLFNMLMGRMLGPAQYGELTALLSLSVIISVGGGAVSTVVMKYSSDMFHSNQKEAIRKLFFKFTRLFLIFSVLLFAIGIALARPIADFFGIDSQMPVIITLIGFIFGYLIVISRGVLLGMQNFKVLAFTNALEMFLKLCLGVVLVKIGFSTSGAIGSVVLATAIIYFVILIPLKKVVTKKKDVSEKPFTFDRKSIIKYTWPAFISALLLVISMNVDVIMVKHFFSAQDAGLYAAVSTVAKIILFLTAPIISVMFPMISEQKTKGTKHYKLFLFSLLFTLLGGLVILGAYFVMPSRILSILYGAGYTSLYYLLPEVGIVVLFYSLINLLSNYFLAIRDFVFLWFFGAITVMQIISIYLWHPSITIVVRTLITSFGLLLFLMMGYYLYTKKDQISLYLRGEYEE
ncbi:MAG: oligosaccharide flippase family protein [Candidatus Berkelbacteria bacterium]